MTVLNMDCIEGMRLFPDAYFDSIVCDPPYELGFMGKSWDASGIANNVEMWTEALRVLKPGGHLLAFSGSRTYHRMVCAIEDAGFEIRDQIMWVYGSGFPKSLDVSKAIDKAGPPGQALFAEFASHYETQRKAKGLTHAAVCAAGGWHGAVNHGGSSVNWANGYGMPTTEQWTTLRDLLDLDEKWAERVARIQYEREVLGVKHGTRLAVAPGQENDRSATGLVVTAAGSDAARQWQGWGTALKPAHEPIVVARKPLIGTVAANVLQFGTGAINVDGCRVPGWKPQVTQGINSNATSFNVTKERQISGDSDEGRWPANLIHDGSDEVLAAFPQDAARFYYAAKASKKDRNSGLDGLEEVIIEPFGDTSWGIAARRVRLLVDTEQSPPRVTDAFGTPLKNAIEWSMMLFGNEPTALSQQDTTCTTETKIKSTIGLTTLSYFQRFDTSENTAGARSTNPESGGNPAENAATSILSMTTTNARMASALGVDLAASPMRLKISVGAMRSDHPTVKPTDLMRYLCRLVTPPGGTVLDPFTGSGSTGKAARLEGFGFIGFELSEEYTRIATARIAGVTVP